MLEAPCSSHSKFFFFFLQSVQIEIFSRVNNIRAAQFGGRNHARYHYISDPVFSGNVYAGKSIWTLKILGRESQSWRAGSREQRQHCCAMESWWQTDPHCIRVLVQILYDVLSGPSYQHCWGLVFIVPLPEERDPQAYSELLPWEKVATSGLRPSPRASVIWSPTAKGQNTKRKPPASSEKERSQE